MSEVLNSWGVINGALSEDCDGGEIWARRNAKNHIEVAIPTYMGITIIDLDVEDIVSEFVEDEDVDDAVLACYAIIDGEKCLIQVDSSDTLYVDGEESDISCYSNEIDFSDSSEYGGIAELIG